VLWPKGLHSLNDLQSIDVGSLVITLAAAIALFIFKRNVIHVIAAAGMVGLLITLVMK
jgi:chromate transporter